MLTSKEDLSASSGSSDNCYCDICIIHCAEDVEKILSRPLFENLQSLGFVVFFVAEEEGQALTDTEKNAIRSSVAHIAVFSINFVKSPSKLDALSSILKSNTNALFIPVYYDVQPWHLRYVHKGVYAQTFVCYRKDGEGKYTDEVCLEWEHTLNHISFLYGMELTSRKFRGDITKLVDAITSKLLMYVKKEPLDVADHPVGLEETLKNYQKISEYHHDQNVNAGGVRIVGIVGMEGSGKTTLAKAVYNDVFSKSTRSSFLFNVSELSLKYGVVRLQKKLLKDLLQIKPKITTPDEGKLFLREQLMGLKVLIVLDNVSHENQVESLLVSDVLDLNSYIIVTTSNSRILQRAHVTSIYHMKPLGDKHARELFCRHAFAQSLPLAGYERYVLQLLKVCDGLPLSLKVIGEHLCGKYAKDYWQHEADKFSKQLPSEIKKIMDIAYNSLQNEEKRLFISLALAVISKENKLLKSVLEEESSRQAFQTLEERCFITRNKRTNQLKLHNQFVIFAKQIADSHPDSALDLPKVLESPLQKQDGLLPNSKIGAKKRKQKHEQYKRLQSHMISVGIRRG